MNIALCDDDNEFRSILRVDVRLKFEDAFGDVCVDEYSSGEDFLAGCDTCSYDCVFLDLYMGGITGFTTAAKLARKNCDTKIIFLTSNDTLVYDSFEYQPFYFLRKSNYMEVLPKVIKKLKLMSMQKNVFMLDGRCEKEQIPIETIRYIMSKKHDITIYTTSFEYDMRKTLSDAEKELSDYDFVKIHRQCIVNLRHVKKVSMRDEKVTMTDGTVLDMSRRCKENVVERYMEYRRGMSNV